MIVQRPKIKSPIFFIRNLPKCLYFIIPIAQLHWVINFWMPRNFPKIFFQDFEKLVRGMQMGFFNIVICEKSVRDSSSVMNTFSLSYKCSFHLVYFVYSANAQFLHSNDFEDSTWSTLVARNWPKCTTIYIPKKTENMTFQRLKVKSLTKMINIVLDTKWTIYRVFVNAFFSVPI